MFRKIGNLNYDWNNSDELGDQSSFHLMHKIKKVTPQQLKGSGIIDTISNIYRGFKDDKLVSSVVGLLPKDELSRPGFPGERHQLLLKNGKLVSANFSG